MNVGEFEQQVWEVDNIRIVLRAPQDRQVDGFDRSNAATETLRVTQWLDNRIFPKIGDIEVVVIQGDGEQPHGGVVLRTIRASYQS